MNHTRSGTIDGTMTHGDIMEVHITDTAVIIAQHSMLRLTLSQIIRVLPQEL